MSPRANTEASSSQWSLDQQARVRQALDRLCDRCASAADVHLLRETLTPGRPDEVDEGDEADRTLGSVVAEAIHALLGRSTRRVGPAGPAGVQAMRRESGPASVPW